MLEDIEKAIVKLKDEGSHGGYERTSLSDSSL